MVNMLMLYTFGAARSRIPCLTHTFSYKRFGWSDDGKHKFSPQHTRALASYKPTYYICSLSGGKRGTDHTSEGKESGMSYGWRSAEYFTTAVEESCAMYFTAVFFYWPLNSHTLLFWICRCVTRNKSFPRPLAERF